MANMYHVNLERDDACSMANGVELRLPFLDKNLVEFALNIPVRYKISGSDDKLRKNILRKTAFNLGLDKQIAYRPKLYLRTVTPYLISNPGTCLIAVMIYFPGIRFIFKVANRRYEL